MRLPYLLQFCQTGVHMSFELPPKKESPESEHDQKQLERVQKVVDTEVMPHPEFSDDLKKFLADYMKQHPNHIWGDVNGVDMHFQSIKKTADGNIEVEVWSDDGYMLGPDIIKLPDHLK